jgi:hypothetical protein
MVFTLSVYLSSNFIHSLSPDNFIHIIDEPLFERNCGRYSLQHVFLHVDIIVPFLKLIGINFCVNGVVSSRDSVHVVSNVSKSRMLQVIAGPDDEEESTQNTSECDSTDSVVT